MFLTEKAFQLISRIQSHLFQVIKIESTTVINSNMEYFTANIHLITFSFFLAWLSIFTNRFFVPLSPCNCNMGSEKKNHWLTILLLLLYSHLEELWKKYTCTFPYSNMQTIVTTADKYCWLSLFRTFRQSYSQIIHHLPELFISVVISSLVELDNVL